MCDIDFWRIRLHGRLPHASKPVDNATATDKVTTIVRNMVEKSGKERDLYNCCFYCSATRATTQVLQPKSVNKRYRGRHMFISVHILDGQAILQRQLISWLQVDKIITYFGKFSILPMGKC